MADVSTAEEPRPYRNKRDDGVARKQVWAWVSPDLKAAIAASAKRHNQTLSARMADDLASHYGIEP